MPPFIKYMRVKIEGKYRCYLANAEEDIRKNYSPVFLLIINRLPRKISPFFTHFFPTYKPFLPDFSHFQSRYQARVSTQAVQPIARYNR